MKKERNSNFELMRIISMIFIILWHILSHGHIIENCGNPQLKIFFKFIWFLIIVHVNSFVLLMGFFQSKSIFRLSKLLNLVLQVIFFCVVLLLISIKLNWIEDYNIITIFNYSIPSSVSYYWFINTYIIVYMLSDHINVIIDKLSRKQFKRMIIVSLIVLVIIPYITGFRTLYNDGYTFFNFIILYLIGAYIRRYPIKETYHFNKLSINGYRLLLLGIIFSMALSNYLIWMFADSNLFIGSFIGEISKRILASQNNYSTPFAIIQSVAYFELFRSFKLKSKIINYISSFVFGIYLFHEFPYVRSSIYQILKIDTGLFYGYKKLIYIIIGLCIIFIMGFVMELIRKLLFYGASKLKPVKCFINKIKSFTQSFNFNINW